jgi:hypothetical protein
MMIDEHMITDCLIVEAVRALCREERLGCPVLPFDVWSFGDEFGVYAVEGTIRRRMARMAAEGRLIRVGERRGYMVPDWRRVDLEVLPDVTASEYVSFDYAVSDSGLLDAVG